MRKLDEFLASAEEFLRLADTVAAWEDDRTIHNLMAAEAATTPATADRWEAAGTAYERAVAAYVEATHQLIIHMMREFARLTVSSREEEGDVEAALRHWRTPTRSSLRSRDGTEGFHSWYESGEIQNRRACVPAQAERFAEALTEAEAAVAAHEQGGQQGEIPRAEAVKFAALVEGNGPGHVEEAVARLRPRATLRRRDRAGRRRLHQHRPRRHAPQTHPTSPAASRRGGANAEHRKVRARIEHAFARTQHYKILRDCRQRGAGLHHAVQRRPHAQLRPRRMTRTASTRR